MNNVATSFVPTGDVSEQVKILEDKMKDLGIKGEFCCSFIRRISCSGICKKTSGSRRKIILIGTPNGGYKNWSFGKGILI